jgi:FAD synthase
MITEDNRSFTWCRCEKVIRHGSSWTLGRFDGVHQSLRKDAIDVNI